MELLKRARALYDDPHCPLAAAARTAWRGGFASGGAWMRLALEELRGVPLAQTPARLNLLGGVKYGLASAAALAFGAAALSLSAWPLWLCCVPAFYAVEAQLVFLFPLALDGSRRPFADARHWTVRAGGTLAVLRVVLPLAGVMLLGGFARQGFVRSWCLGCLAICLWYEELRTCSGR